jgi:hypothetical protein
MHISRDTSFPQVCARYVCVLGCKSICRGAPEHTDKHTHTHTHTHIHTHTHTHRSAHASRRGEPIRDYQEGGSSSRPDRARSKGVGGRARKDSEAAGKEKEDSEFGDDDIPFPLDAATLDQLMPKRGRPIGAKDTKQRKKRMGMSVISLARTHVTADTYVHDRGHDFINALIAHLHVSWICVLL